MTRSSGSSGSRSAPRRCSSSVGSGPGPLPTRSRTPRAISRSDAGVAADGDLGLFARVPDTPGGAVAGRVLTYYRRDPRFQVAVVTTPLVPLLLLVPVLRRRRRVGAPAHGAVHRVPARLGRAQLRRLRLRRGLAARRHGDPAARADRRGRLVASVLLAVVLAADLRASSAPGSGSGSTCSAVCSGSRWPCSGRVTGSRA